mmetsp:Transcript_23265/g.59442  ORF Transcript_23265/g.59442 Transcript_23265/m.59442 type:complete len:273 (-) Transcript_23265:27-845(-)
MVTCMRPPPDAILQSAPWSLFMPARKSSSCCTNVREEPSGTSRPSVRMCTRTFLAPRSTAPLTVPYSWSARECTPPSDSSPMKCTVWSANAGAMCFHPAPSNILPVSRAMSTRRAPWSTTWPAPRALCPTSELPMSASEGRPTARPWALTVRKRPGTARSLSTTGVLATCTALNSSLNSFSPNPSRITTSTGPSWLGIVGWASSFISSAIAATGVSVEGAAGADGAAAGAATGVGAGAGAGGCGGFTGSEVRAVTGVGAAAEVACAEQQFIY